MHGHFLPNEVVSMVSSCWVLVQYNNLLCPWQKPLFKYYIVILHATLTSLIHLNALFWIWNNGSRKERICQPWLNTICFEHNNEWSIKQTSIDKSVSLQLGIGSIWISSHMHITLWLKDLVKNWVLSFLTLPDHSKGRSSGLQITTTSF